MRKPTSLLGAAAVLALSAALLPPTAAAEPAAGETLLVSRSNDGAVGNGRSGAPAVSADGQRVAFVSGATNVHPDDVDNRRSKALFERLGFRLHERRLGTGERRDGSTADELVYVCTAEDWPQMILGRRQ